MGNKFRTTLGLCVGSVMNCADNTGAKGSMRLLRDGDPGLHRMAREEPFQLELAAMLLRAAQGKAYSAEALAADGFEPYGEV